MTDRYHGMVIITMKTPIKIVSENAVEAQHWLSIGIPDQSSHRDERKNSIRWSKKKEIMQIGEARVSLLIGKKQKSQWKYCSFDNG